MPGWSEVTSELTFLGAATVATPVPSAVQVWGCVDGELDPVGGVAWQFNVRREGEGWEIERVVTLNPNSEPDRPQRVAAALPTIQFPSSSEMAAKLPEAVRELLALSLPTAGPEIDQGS